MIRRLIMYSKARRTMVVCILGFIGIPAFVYSYKYVFGLDLYEGDEVEERECRYCGGTGRDEELALEMPGHSGRCPACAGRGEVQVILPGPHRPVRFRGLVLDALKAPESSQFVRLPETQQSPFKKHPAAIAGATVTFIPVVVGDSITLNTNGHGRFSARLIPGEYRVEVRAARRSALRDQFVVRPLVAPIWLEEAKIHEPLSGEAARSKYGMAFRARLARKPGSGELILEPASPWLAP